MILKTEIFWLWDAGKKNKGDPASGHVSEASMGKRMVGGYLIFLPLLGPADKRFQF